MMTTGLNLIMGLDLSVNEFSDAFSSSRLFFKKMANPGLSLQYQYKIEKSKDGVLGTWTQGGRMVGADESTELWRHPMVLSLSVRYG